MGYRVLILSRMGTLSMIELKQMGVGLAAAILIDATVIRAVLLPAAMTLLGEANWYLPKWLGWLPKVNVEGGAEPAAGPASPVSSGAAPQVAAPAAANTSA